ncbi:MAG: NUDIX domain-containing protein [Myxococcales bacterium]|nr:NUDIX domain-containing protein [Myxococcales bacterium]
MPPTRASTVPGPALTVDVVVLTVLDRELMVVLHQRPEAPFAGSWALPGGFCGLDESLESAARRVLGAKAGIHDVFLEQLYTFGAVHRDPRFRVVTVAWIALVDSVRLKGPNHLARIEVPWEGETGGPVDLFVDSSRIEPAFDHDAIIGMAVKRLRGKLDYTPIGFQLLGSTFTLNQLRHVHETILGKPLNKDSFRRRMLATGHLEATGDREEDVGHRPAALYRFVRRSAL